MPKKNVKKETGDSIEDTIKSIQSRFGDEALMKLGEKPKVNVNAIPTGSLGLDLALGIGGVPRGRVIEVYGPESSGKTTLALHIIAEAQKKGGICAFIDAEHAMDPEYSKKLGVKIDVIVIDSVAALTPKDEIEGDVGAHHVGKQARLMSQALRKMTAITAKSKTTVIFINQIRMQIGVMFGNPETTPGGKALKFYSSVRLDVRRIAQIKKGEEIVGGRVRVKVVKNKVAAPFKVAEFDILYNEGISPEGEIIALAEKYDIIKKSGAFYSYTDSKDEKIKLGQGYDATRTFLKENPKTMAEIVKKVKKGLEED